MRVGILDSGVAAPATARRRFLAATDVLRTDDSTDPVHDHGSVVASLIRENGPTHLELLDAQIFGERLHCAPALAAAAIDWLIESDASVINVSWGLAGDDPALRKACAQAIQAGVWIVAATPIRGATPVPARYPGVVSATGDARCRPHEISDFGGVPAEFGADPTPNTGAHNGPRPLRGGSSFACARICGVIAKILESAPHCDPRLALQARATHRGPQTRP